MEMILLGALILYFFRTKKEKPTAYNPELDDLVDNYRVNRKISAKYRDGL